MPRHTTVTTYLCSHKHRTWSCSTHTSTTYKIENTPCEDQRCKDAYYTGWRCCICDKPHQYEFNCLHGDINHNFCSDCSSNVPYVEDPDYNNVVKSTEEEEIILECWQCCQ